MRYLGFPVHSVSLSFTYLILPSHFLEFWLFQINHNGHKKEIEGTSWMLPSKSGSKYFLKNMMTENIWKIFAPWRGPQLKLLFSTFFQVTVYLVDTQNFRVSWRPLHVFFVNISANIGHIWSKKIFGIIFWELSIV